MGERKLTTQKRTFRTVERGDFVNLGKTLDPDGKPILHAEGEWVDGDEIQYSTGPVGRYTLKHDDGTLVKVFGSSVLDEYFQTAEIGQYVVIDFLPDSVIKTGNNRNMKDYRFQIAE